MRHSKSALRYGSVCPNVSPPRFDLAGQLSALLSPQGRAERPLMIQVMITRVGSIDPMWPELALRGPVVVSQLFTGAM